MSYLAIAQYMAAAAFLTVAVTHLIVWSRVRSEINHILFAMAAVAAGANAIAEESMYRADSIGMMSVALRWYVATSGCWAIATVCFIVAYARVGRVARFLAIAICVAFGIALVINLFSPSSYLYTQITGLREITLPWGEQISLAVGTDNPLRIMTELAWLAILGVVADGCFRFWVRKQRTKAALFGIAVVGFMACFGTHAFLVDTGRLDSPYLSTYGFLALVGLMSYELAGQAFRTAELSSQLQQKETELRTAVAEERSRIAGDLHDSVTQTLFSTAAIADALPEVWERHPEEAMRGLNDLKQLTKGALAEMRTLLWEMRPEALLERDLGSLLQQLANASASRSRVRVDVVIDGDRRYPNDVQIALYRIAQEALHNVTKHARATQASLQLSCQGEDVELKIHDNGLGFDEGQTPSGLGLGIMRERARAVGGEMTVESKLREGTTVTVHLTITKKNELG